MNQQSTRSEESEGGFNGKTKTWFRRVGLEGRPSDNKNDVPFDPGIPSAEDDLFNIPRDIEDSPSPDELLFIAEGSPSDENVLFNIPGIIFEEDPNAAIMRPRRPFWAAVLASLSAISCKIF
jgi:hypothetical protein